MAVTAEPATDDDYGSLRTVHALLAEQQPLPHIDGPYLAWGDLVVEPATGLHRPWTLSGELHHDGDCFEINPVTWYTLATYGVTVRGPAPDTLGIPTDMEARVRFVVDNLPAVLDARWPTTSPRSCVREPDAGIRAPRPSCGARSGRCGCTSRRSPATSPPSAGAGGYGLEGRARAVPSDAARGASPFGRRVRSARCRPPT